MLFVCHPKFYIWCVMVFPEWSIVPQVEQPLAAVTCSITGGEFKSFTRTTLGQFRYFLSYCAPSLFFFFSIFSARALEIPVFYLVSVHAFMLGFAFFFSSFVYYAITVCFLTCCLHALLVVLISACYVIFTCRLHIVPFFSVCPSIFFPWLSVCFIYLIVLSHCHVALGFLDNFLVTTWSRYSFAYKVLIFRRLTKGPTVS